MSGTIHWDLVSQVRDLRAEAEHPICHYCRNTDRRRWCRMCDYTGYSEEKEEDE